LKRERRPWNDTGSVLEDYRRGASLHSDWKCEESSAGSLRR
jgi:hypothetical protein